MVSKISTIIPVYNQGNYLAVAIDSVLHQGYPEVEIIVVNDGSTDNSISVAKGYGNKITLVDQGNAGAAKARSAGLECATGDLIHFLDGDDAISGGMYKEASEALESHPDWTAFVTRTAYMDSDSNPLPGRGPLLPTGRWFPLLACHNPTSPGAVVFRRSVLQEVEGFDINLKFSEDWDFWLQIARTGAIFGASKFDKFKYRLHSLGKSRNALRGFDAWKKVLTRAHGPDFRVRKPAKEFEKGRNPDLLHERLVWAAASSLGKAVAGRDHRGVEELLVTLFDLTNGNDLSVDQRLSMGFHAAASRGSSLRSPMALSFETIRFLSEFTTSIKSGSPLSEFWAKLFPDIISDRSRGWHWEDNYRRLAKAMPVKQLLWIRRRLRGLQDPGDSELTVQIPAEI